MSHSYGTKAEMVPEVTAAANFVSRLLRTRGYLSEHQLQVFRDGLQQALSGSFFSLNFSNVCYAYFLRENDYYY